MKLPEALHSLPQSSPMGARKAHRHTRLGARSSVSSLFPPYAHHTITSIH